MKSQILDKNYSRYHFIGIGGVSMSALAKYLIYLGKSVSGSDCSDSQRINELKDLGAKVFVGQVEKVDFKPDVVVYSSAIKEDDGELLALKEQGARIAKRSELLGEIISLSPRSIGIAGSHGKTTATAMLANALIEAKAYPTVFLGGDDKNFGNYNLGKGEISVAEVCEYKKNLLDIFPSIAVVLNIDNDHLDSYKDMQDVVDCFSKYISGGIAVINADDKYYNSISHSSTISFGINNLATYTATGIRENNGKYSFTARAYGRKLGRIKLNVSGKHNVYNALVTVAVCEQLKIPFRHVKRALEGFDGVNRRMEEVGEFKGCKIVCDYAHHPSEIIATLKSLEDNRAFTIFQPHTYSRTEKLMNEFCESLINEKNLVIYKTYPAREEYCRSGDGKTLYDSLLFKGKTDCYYADSPESLKTLINELASSGKCGLALGAGDIYDIIKGII